MKGDHHNPLALHDTHSDKHHNVDVFLSIEKEIVRYPLSIFINLQVQESVQVLQVELKHQAMTVLRIP